MAPQEFHSNRSNAIKLHDKQEFLDKLPEFLPDFVFWKNTKSVYLGCNKNFANLLGFQSADEIVGKTDADLPWQVPGDTAEIFQASDKEALTGKPVIGREETLLLPNGTRIETLLSKGRVADNDGHVLGVVGYFSDITEHKAREKALRIAKREAEAAARAKSDFIANMSHDIRTPLTGLIGMANTANEILMTLSRDAVAGSSSTASGLLLQAQEAVSVVSDSANSLLLMLNGVLDLILREHQASTVQEKPFSPVSLLQHVAQLMKPSFKAKGLDFVLAGIDRLPTAILSDWQRLEKILLNLLSNAVKFTESGQVELAVQLRPPISASSGKTLLELSVRDTGIGIPVEQEEIIFQPFTRLDPAYNGNHSGAGLGLHIVRQYIDELGGTIDVTSAIDQGSTFLCTLPVELPALSQEPVGLDVIQVKRSESTTVNQSHTIKGDTGLSSVSQAVKVLLVEDQKIPRRVAADMLSRFGCQVDTAENCEIALEKATSNHYDFILMDIGLPDGDGHQVTQDIRAWEAREKRETMIPIVALTAHADLQKCLDSGMQLAFNKPLKAAYLEDIFKRFDFRHPSDLSS